MASDPSDERPSLRVPITWTTVEVALGAAAVALLLSVGRGRTFFFDEWDWVQHRAHGGVTTLLRPHNGHLMPLPVALYRLQFAVLGFTPAWPVRLVTAVTHVAAAGVLLRLARPRVGASTAAAAAAVFLALGAAWQTLLWGLQLSVTLAVLGGLVAWLALDADSRRGDVVACVALVVAAASFSIGPVFAVAVAVELVLRGRRRSWWVPTVPLAAFGVAYVVYGDSGLTAAGARGAAGWALDAAAAAAGGLAVLGPGWGRAVLVVLAAGCVAAVARSRATPRLAGLVTAGVLCWTLTGASRSAGPQADSPFASRYIEIGAPILLLVGVELARSRPPSGWWRVPLAAVVAVCVWRGVDELVARGAGLRENSDVVLAGIAAMEIARPHVDPNMIPVGDVAPQIRAENYFAAVDARGSSPAGDDPDARLARLPAAAQRRADLLLAAVEVRGTPAPTDPSGCRTVSADVIVEMDAGTGVRIVASDDVVTLAVRRFAHAFEAAPAPTVAPGGATTIDVLTDLSTRPWHLRASSSAPFRICPPSPRTVSRARAPAR